MIAKLKVTETKFTKCTKLIVTKNIFNLQEWPPKYAKLQIFIPANLIVYKTFTVGIKSLWLFYKGVS